MAILAQVDEEINSFSDRLDFWNKSKALETMGYAMDSLDFYRLLYGADYDYMKVFCFSNSIRMKRERDGQDYNTRTVAMTVDDMMVYAEDRKDLYYYPCSFRADSAKRVYHQKQYAITLDLDKVDCVQLQHLHKANWFGFKPTMVVNSGNGLHLLYVFNEPYEPSWGTRRSQRNMLQSTIDSIANIIMVKLIASGFSCYIDKNSRPFVHAYRCVGSLTKAGERVKAYRVGGLYSAEGLFKRLGIVQDKTVDKESKKPKRKRGTTTTSTSARLCLGKLANKKWYKTIVGWLLDGLFKEGNREKSLYALSVIALKCGVSYESLEQDCRFIINSQRSLVTPFSEKDLKKAIGWYSKSSYLTDKAYADKLQKVFYIPKESISEWLGREWQKRNYEERAVHLAKCRRTKADKIEKLAERIRKYMDRHPKATRPEIAKRYGVSVVTIKRIIKSGFRRKKG